MGSTFEVHLAKANQNFFSRKTNLVFCSTRNTGKEKRKLKINIFELFVKYIKHNVLNYITLKKAKMSQKNRN